MKLTVLAMSISAKFGIYDGQTLNPHQIFVLQRNLFEIIKGGQHG